MGCLGEIDHHVSAEDHVERAPHWPSFDQVQGTETHEITGWRGNAPFPSLFAGLRPFLNEVRRHFFDLGPREQAGPGSCEYRLIDISRENLQVVPSQAVIELEQGHRDRIGLLAGRAARRPDPDAVAGTRAGQNVRRDLRPERLKMTLLAKEARDIRGKRRDQVRNLGGAAFTIEHRQIGSEFGASRRAQTPDEPRLHHGALACRNA